VGTGAAIHAKRAYASLRVLILVVLGGGPIVARAGDVIVAAATVLAIGVAAGLAAWFAVALPPEA
jgi:hypothetical protein